MRALSSVVIGDAAVTLRCAEILLERGHAVAGLVTGDGRVAAWAAERGVACHFAPADAPLAREAVEELAGGKPFDLLLSIHNLRILRREVLALPRRMAVNYHDALLPRYAGLHATTWAILGGETVHGITWHRMTEEVDAGEVLVQRRLLVAPDDTAWTLNVRCTEAAIDAFPELIEILAADPVALRPQEPGARTWFPGWRKPAAGCVVPWDAPAETVWAFVRALDFGAADNPLGLPKLIAPGGTFLLQDIEVLERRSGLPPGTVVAGGPGGLEVATATQDVRLGSLATPAGRAAPEEATGLAPGFRLALSAPAAEHLAARERVLHRHEGAWTARLAELAPLAPPGFQDPLAGSGEQRVDTEVPPDLLPEAAELPDAVLAWLFCEIGQPFDVALGEPGLRRELAASGWTGLLTARPPLRVDLLGPGTLREALERLRQERERHQARGTYGVDLPARIRRLRARPGSAEPAVALDLLEVEEEPPPPGPATTLAVAISGRRLTWRGPRADLLDGLASRFLGWLSAVAAAPDQPLSPLLPPVPALLPELFRVQAERSPDALALVAAGASWTWCELAERVERLAAALRRRGVGPERLVALRLERLPDLVTGMLGVLAAGGAFLVLDPLDPPWRAAQLLEEARPFLALGGPGLHRLAPDLPIHPIAIADAREGPEPAGDPSAAGWNLAYVAFTSGSTGTPKGVAVEHQAIARYILAAGRRFGLGAGDRLLQLGSPAFDLAFEQIFASLCHGATLVGMEEPGLPGSRELLAACERQGITVLDLPTSVWEQAVRDAAALALPRPPGLRLAVIGGEAAQAWTLHAWLAWTGGGVRLLNTYGPTECTVVATWWEAPPGEEPPREGWLPIGQPVQGTEVWIDEAGELWLGGGGLARGYHRRPELTAARFVRLDAAGGRRLYRTGDRVRRGPDGGLEYLGRLDRQLKIGGRRVEPDEVEAVLRGIPGVLEAAVAPQESASGSLRLVAWVALQENAAVDAVRDEAARRLPPFLCPARLTPVPALPRTRAGKIDLQALRQALPAQERRGEAPRGEVEERLAAIWERLLGAGAVSRHDDFFDLGGDSLSAVALLAEIERFFGRRVPVSRLLRAATLAALAGEIQEAGALETGSCLVSLQPEGALPPFVCVHGLGGHLLRLIPLARELAPERPFLGLQSPGLDDDAPIPRTIEELARTFLAELRARLGPGPYLLGGMSFGGIVAFEMARQMAAVGERPGLLVLLDTDLSEVLPGFKPSPPPWNRRLLERLRRLVGDRLGRGRRLARRLLGGPDEAQKANEYRNFTRVVHANDEALDRYRPGPYPGTVTYFAATERAPALFEEFIRRTGCDLRIIPVPGDHLGMLEPPHVEMLAALLRQEMPDRW